MTIGERLKALRTQRGYSQEQVAKMLGIGRTTYLKYENGENKPSRKLNELASLFGVTTDYLLGRATEPAKRAATLSEDAVNDIFDDEDLRALARDRLEGATPAEIANNKKRLKRMIEVMFDAEDND
ncbi:MAG: helix-turn-helix domain-containing protein [Selenomonadaceae bacterium]|nr:helix-turn-helix domain-containing protein [Selenomonadaceae bacterium]